MILMVVFQKHGFFNALLMPGRNNFNPTLLGRSMKNNCRALEKVCAGHQMKPPVQSLWC
jgi:hypothetical protein